MGSSDLCLLCLPFPHWAMLTLCVNIGQLYHEGFTVVCATDKHHRRSLLRRCSSFPRTHTHNLLKGLRGIQMFSPQSPWRNSFWDDPCCAAPSKVSGWFRGGVCRGWFLRSNCQKGCLGADYCAKVGKDLQWGDATRQHDSSFARKMRELRWQGLFWFCIVMKMHRIDRSNISFH